MLTDTTNFDLELTILNDKLQKLKANNYFLRKKLKNFIKEYNNEIHNQQYFNDSLFEEVLLIRDDVNANLNDMKKLERSIYYEKRNIANLEQDTRINLNVIVIFLVLVYLLTALFLLLNRRRFNRYCTHLNEKVKKYNIQIESQSNALKDYLLKMFDKNEKSFKELNEQLKNDLNKKIIDHKSHTDSRFREISNQIDDKFS